MTEKENKKVTASDRIKELEDEISKTKYNKKTQHHIGLIKAKIAALKEKQESRGKGGAKAEGYAVRKSGDATVVLVGFPSVGKSTLLNNLTNADSKVGAYAFTTLEVIPGLLEHKSAKIQILDVPGIMQGAAAGTGRGREVISIMRNADLLLIIIEANNLKQLDVLMKEIQDAKIRINQVKPDVKIVKTSRGGIDLGITCKLTHLKKETIVGMLKEFKIMNAQVVIREDIDADQLIDIIDSNRFYVPSIVLINKIDMVDESIIQKIQKEINPDLFISAHKKINLELLKDQIFNKLNFIRIYTKEINKPAKMNEPLIMKKNTTIQDVCRKLHKDFVKKFKYAKIWGSSKFPGQELRKLDRVLEDNDLIEIHLI
ncbi:GTP-binding protein [Candidatus Woesearchaeota archaeon]|nr:GTP-binding protein [Candidatus Woesearchaeota archaeon]